MLARQGAPEAPFIRREYLRQGAWEISLHNELDIRKFPGKIQ
jgi:hypothetical protein